MRAVACVSVSSLRAWRPAGCGGAERAGQRAQSRPAPILSAPRLPAHEVGLRELADDVEARAVVAQHPPRQRRAVERAGLRAASLRRRVDVDKPLAAQLLDAQHELLRRRQQARADEARVEDGLRDVDTRRVLVAEAHAVEFRAAARLVVVCALGVGQHVRHAAVDEQEVVRGGRDGQLTAELARRVAEGHGVQHVVEEVGLLLSRVAPSRRKVGFTVE